MTLSHSLPPSNEPTPDSWEHEQGGGVTTTYHTDSHKHVVYYGASSTQLIQTLIRSVIVHDQLTTTNSNVYELGHTINGPNQTTTVPYSGYILRVYMFVVFAD